MSKSFLALASINCEIDPPVIELHSANAAWAITGARSYIGPCCDGPCCDGAASHGISSGNPPHAKE